MTQNRYDVTRYGCRTFEEWLDEWYIFDTAAAFELPRSDWSVHHLRRLDLEWQRAMFFQHPSYEVLAKEDGTWLHIDGPRYRAAFRLEAFGGQVMQHAVAELRAELLRK